MTAENFDVIVIGGGPGGASLSTFVQMQSHRVLLLEKERFPRYQIGESLLPATVHGICELLGVGAAMKRANFTVKRGGTFLWGRSPSPWTFSFDSARTLADAGASFAYQVERSRFDAILLDNARSKGVDVREQHTVTDVLAENGRYGAVRFVDESGCERTATARFIVDASGNRSGVYRHVGDRVFSKFFRNVALFGYFEDGKRLAPPSEGNILCAAFRQGWFWYIPLSPTLTSVGAVIGRDHFDGLRTDEPESALRGFIHSCPLIEEYLAGARRVTEGQYGQIRSRKDFSYTNSAFWTPGLVLVGDAACFIDPVFSSGVHLATYSALLAARSINTCIESSLSERRCFDEYERRYRLEFQKFHDFLVYFYEMHRDESSYFWSARKILGSEASGREAFIQLVAGCATASPAQLGLGGVSAANVRDLRHEQVQLKNQARQGANRQPEAPLFDGGLIPTRDGFRWMEG